ncbi:MAG: glycosyltransferase family 2 protein [bacterium]
MKISIITVCKNAEIAIERTILSVVSQTYNNIEYIIVDGASTDGTVEWLTDRFLSGGKVEWSNGGDSTGQTHGSAPTHLHTYTLTPNLTLKFVSEPDSGIYQAMNKGIKMATGDYLLFLNAGDYLIHYNVLEIIANILKEGKYDLIHGNCFCVDPVTGVYALINGTENPTMGFFYDNSLPHQAIFYKRTLFEKFGCFDEKYNVFSDSVFNKKVFSDQGTKHLYVDTVVSVYFFDGLSSPKTESAKLLNEKERDAVKRECFSDEELKIIMKKKRRQDKIEKRQKRKSILRLIMKMLSRLNIWWINR